MQKCASFELTLPCHLEEVLWLRQDIVPIEVEESGGANGAGPPPAHTGLAWREECCDPVSAPRSLGPCTPTTLLNMLPHQNQESYPATQFTICSAAGVCKALQVEFVLDAKAMSASILRLCNLVLLAAKLVKQHAYMVHNYKQQHMLTLE